MDVSLPSAMLMHYKWHPCLLTLMLKILFKMLYLENQHDVWCQPCHVPVHLKLTPITVVWSGGGGPGQHMDRIYFSICNSIFYMGEVTIQRKAA